MKQILLFLVFVCLGIAPLYAQKTKKTPKISKEEIIEKLNAEKRVLVVRLPTKRNTLKALEEAIKKVKNPIQKSVYMADYDRIALNAKITQKNIVIAFRTMWKEYPIYFLPDSSSKAFFAGQRENIFVDDSIQFLLPEVNFTAADNFYMIDYRHRVKEKDLLGRAFVLFDPIQKNEYIFSAHTSQFLRRPLKIEFVPLARYSPKYTYTNIDIGKGNFIEFRDYCHGARILHRKFLSYYRKKK